jgi:hypothetical protein
MTVDRRPPTRPGWHDDDDLYDAGWGWCANNRRWYRRQHPDRPEWETRCGGCGQPAPPPFPNPYERKDQHG